MSTATEGMKTTQALPSPVDEDLDGLLSDLGSVLKDCNADNSAPGPGRGQDPLSDESAVVGSRDPAAAQPDEHLVTATPGDKVSPGIATAPAHPSGEDDPCRTADGPEPHQANEPFDNTATDHSSPSAVDMLRGFRMLPFHLLVIMDYPFRNLSWRRKHALGAAGIASMIMACIIWVLDWVTRATGRS